MIFATKCLPLVLFVLAHAPAGVAADGYNFDDPTLCVPGVHDEGRFRCTDKYDLPPPDGERRNGCKRSSEPDVTETGYRCDITRINGQNFCQCKKFANEPGLCEKKEDAQLGGYHCVDNGCIAKPGNNNKCTSVIMAHQLDDKVCGCQPTVDPNGGGDPHFTTWGGERYSFHGECDLVLARIPHFAEGLGMWVHGRTKIHRNWSAFESGAIKIGNDIFEAHGKDEYWINGKRNAELPALIGGYEVSLEKSGAHLRMYAIHLGGKEKIHIKAYNEFIWVSVKGQNARDFVGSEGLLGNYGSGHMVGRDGKTVFSDPNEFGQEWQVHPDLDPQLFHNIEGPQYPQQHCKMPKHPKEDLWAQQDKTRLGAEAVHLADAKKACAHAHHLELDDCIADVFATKNTALAEAY